jgi:Protein of unknown function (DUF2970)
VTKDKRGSALAAAKAVFWAFFGVRKRAAHDSEMVQLTPAQVIVAGVIGAAVFVLILILLVRFITS